MRAFGREGSGDRDAIDPAIRDLAI